MNEETIEEFNPSDEEHKFDLRQAKAWKNYVDPKSPTWNNAKRSAMAAGYTDQTSDIITNVGWWKAKVRRIQMLNKAEKVLKKTLEMDVTDEAGKPKADLVRVQNDTAKFIAKTQGKDEGYSERSEVTGKDGAPIVFMPAELLEKYNLNKEEKVEPLETNEEDK